MRKEIWKTYRKNGWPEGVLFEISSSGRVKNLKNNNFKKLYKVNKYGQLVFAVYLGKKNGKDSTTNVLIHRALAECFIPNPENKEYVIHKDYNQKNNTLSNLIWVNRSELNSHRSKSPGILQEHLRRKKQKIRTNTKLTLGQATILKKMLLNPNRKTRIRILAKQFGVSQMQLYRIKSGENWGSINV